MTVTRRRFGLRLFIVGPLAIGSLMPSQAAAAPQESPAAQQGDIQSAEVDNNGEDFTRPQSLFQLRYLYQTAPGSGSEPGTTRQVTTETLYLREDHRFDFAPQWTLALRGDLPMVTKNPITSNNPSGDDQFGVGDVDFQAAVVHAFDARWAAGIGARLVAPTGGDEFGTGRWQILSGFAVRSMLPEISAGSYFVPQVRYDVSFAGDPSTKNISNLQFAPTLNIGLPDHWFVTFYPSTDIRVNYGDPITGQTGPLFLPFDVLIGRTVFTDVVMSLEISVPIIKDYPVYDFKTVMRLNASF